MRIGNHQPKESTANLLRAVHSATRRECGNESHRFFSPIYPTRLNTGIFLTVDRDDIESGNVSKCLMWLFDIGLTGKDVWNVRQRLSVTITGYESETRELWEIKAVRAYVQNLLNGWPEWMFFVNHSDDTLRMLFLCAVDVERVADSSLYRVTGDLGRFMFNNFEGLSTLFIEYGFRERKRIGICTSVLFYIRDRVTPMLEANVH